MNWDHEIELVLVLKMILYVKSGFRQQYTNFACWIKLSDLIIRVVLKWRVVK